MLYVLRKDACVELAMISVAPSVGGDAAVARCDETRVLHTRNFWGEAARDKKAVQVQVRGYEIDRFEVKIMTHTGGSRGNDMYTLCL